MNNYVSVDDTDQNQPTVQIEVPETSMPERFPAGCVLIKNRSKVRMITNLMPQDRIIVRGDRRYRVDAKGTWRRIRE